MKIGRNVLQVITHRLWKSDFRWDIIPSWWQPWRRSFHGDKCCHLVNAQEAYSPSHMEQRSPVSYWSIVYPYSYFADRTVILLHSVICYCHNPVVCLSACLYVCLWRCALWLSGSLYMTKSCTSVFLAGKFLFAVQTLLRQDVSFSRKTHRKKRIEENASVSFLRQTVRRALISFRRTRNSTFMSANHQVSEKVGHGSKAAEIEMECSWPRSLLYKERYDWPQMSTYSRSICWQVSRHRVNETHLSEKNCLLTRNVSGRSAMLVMMMYTVTGCSYVER